MRIPRFAFLGPIAVGPSWKKLVLDFAMIFWTIGLMIRHRYRVVHAHEEAVFWCRVLKPLFGFKLIYDMHSSLPQQLTNFRFTNSGAVDQDVQGLEDSALRRGRCGHHDLPGPRDLCARDRRRPGQATC